MTIDRRCLSVVVPVYNEQENLAELQQRLVAVFDDLSFEEYEAMLVNDGSSDDSERIITKTVRADPRFKGIFLSRNFGHQAAVSVGLAHARGSVVAVLDGDLQDPPEVLKEFLKEIDRGADVVYGIRRQRKESLWLKLAYWLFYRTLQRISSVYIPTDAGDFCCMRRPVVDAVNQLTEYRRFVRGLRSWVGYRQVGVPYERSNRYQGRSKYNLGRLVRLAYDGLFAFSDLPVKIMQVLGLAVAIVSVTIGLVYLVLALIYPAPAGFPTLIISIWFLGGVQMFFLGLVGEYVHRTFEQSLGRPIALVREVVENKNGGVVRRQPG